MNIETITDTRQYLTFKLDKELYAVYVAHVREIQEASAITKVPRTPEFMRGVINVRGSVVPVIDMRLKLGMQAAKDTIDTCIVIMEIGLEDEVIIIGAVADSVQEVFELPPERIEPAPKIGTLLNTKFIKGIGKHNENFVIILDIEKILTADEIAIVREGSEGVNEENVLH
ncbi:MAG: chemotaxis protein CheW [Nitrospirae bacterium]|nr:chemotaxis protein CheW [Nitrospirota bacterium]